MPWVELGPVARHETLAEDVYQKLRTAIMAGGLKPGEKISARNVAQSAEVSLTPAREAVTRLIGEGALQLVGPKTVIVPMLSVEVLDEITQIRTSVEGLASEVACKNFTAADLRELETIQATYEKVRSGQNFQRSLVVNDEFHFKIYRASQMPRLISYIETLWLQMGPSFNLLKGKGTLSDRPLSYHHKAIEGLRARDSAAVRQAIQDDIAFGYERLRTSLTT